MINKRTPKSKSETSLNSAKRQRESLTERLLEVFALYGLSKNLNITLQGDNILGEVEKLLKASLRISDFSILLLDETGETLTVWKASSPTFEATKEISFKLGEGISGLVAQNGTPIVVQDVDKDKRFLHYMGKKTDVGSFYSVPLKTNQDDVIGVFNIHKPEKRGFRESDFLVFNEVASHISQALENSKLFQNTRKQAITDGLTQLYSRRFFMEALEKELSNALRHRSIFSIIMVDVDNFKSINDTYGHLVGDDVLRRLAKIMNSYTRQGDTLARYGGEEFILLLPGIGKADTAIVAEKLRAQVEKCLTIERKEGSPVNVTISVGVASFPESGKEIFDIIDCADKRLYFAKRTGRNKVCCSMEERPPEQESDEKRVEKRLPMSLQITRKLQEVQCLEISFRGKWMMCTVFDICQKGFKGSVEFKPEKGEEYQFKLVTRSVLDTEDSFLARVVRIQKTDGKRYSIGVEVHDDMIAWNNFYYNLTR